MAFVSFCWFAFWERNENEERANSEWVSLPEVQVAMDVIEDRLKGQEEEGKKVDWTEILELFRSLNEDERRRFSWVAPQQEDLQWLKELLGREKAERLIGIGCGSGFLERIVAEYCELPVIGVELKDSWWMSKFHPRIFVPIEFTNTPGDISNMRIWNDGEKIVLLFCYFNNSRAFNEYLKVFQAEILILVGPKDNVGIHTDPMPMAPVFEDSRWHFWDCRYLDDGLNVICLYKKRTIK